MTVTISKQESEFASNNIIKEKDGRFIELIKFLEEDCGASYKNNKYEWSGNYEDESKNKYNYKLNYYLEDREQFEVFRNFKGIKICEYYSLRDLYNKFFKPTKTMTITIDVKVNEDGSADFRYKNSSNIELKDGEALFQVIENILTETQNVRNYR